jgi:hypothetical protein
MYLDSESDKIRRDCLTVRDAYLAMFYFVDAYWCRGGANDGSVTLVRHDLGPASDPDDESLLQTTDPAFWEDWLTAIEKARSQGIPAKL